MEKGITTIKEAWKQLLQDIRSVRYVIICTAVYWVMTRILFHHFCPMVFTTGFPCPGCGMTRAAFHLLIFQWDEAWKFNPAIYPWAVWGIWAAWKRYIKKETKVNHTKPLIVVFGITFLCYLWRMAVLFPSDVPPMVYEQNNIFEKTLPFYGELISRIV